tara:strand:- start:3055 stop:5730 length:2676 start_codon:yes stop_codon:yes gene_type:complete
MAINNKLLGGATGDTPSSLDPRDHFGTVLYTGNSTTHVVNGGKYDACASFNGTNSEIELGSGNIGLTFGASAAYSVSFWFKTSTISTWMRLFNFCGVGGDQANQLAVSIYQSKLELLRRTGGTTATSVEKTPALSSDTWYQVVITQSGTTTTVYVNGTSQTLTSDAATSISSVSNITFGSQGYAPYYSGLIDQIRIYDSVLSSSDATALASESYADSFKVNFPTGKTVKALYRLNGNTNDETGAYDGTASNVTWKYGVNFTPDWVWFKARTDTRTHSLVDSVRGFNGSSARVLQSDSASAQWESAYINSFNVGGFTLSGSENYINNSSHNYVAWCWNAGGSSVTNDTGTVDSTVRANTDSGFSIVQTTSPSTTINFNYGHGLSKAPELIFVKTTGISSYWEVMYPDTFGQASGSSSPSDWNRIKLNEADAVMASNAYLAADGTKIYNGAWGANTALINYCFHSVDSYQKIGTYTGSGVSGKLVETGFKPAFLMIKKSSGTGSWYMFDNERKTGVYSDQLIADTTAPEATGTYVKFLDDGFQLDTTASDLNTGSQTFLYLAIAAPPETTTPTLASSFKVSTWTGDSSNDRSIDGIGFKPSLVWVKKRSNTEPHALYDSVRGANKQLETNDNDAEATNSGSYLGVNSFNTDGFTVGNNGGTNRNPETYVSWSWKASDSTDILTAGSIDSLVSVNDEAGFSIVKYIGNNTSGATIAHGLSAVPNVIITKRMDSTGDWLFYHSALGATKYLIVNSDAAAYTVSNVWNDTAPTSSVFSIGNYAEINTSGGEYIAYCFRAISEYSHFGSYTGDRPNTVTVTTGFQPDFVLIKDSTNSGEGWAMVDSVRGNNLIEADEEDGDTSYSSVTFISTGFTVGDSGLVNTDNATIVYMAFKMN